MNEIPTKLYCAVQAGETIHMSLGSLSESEMDEHFARDPNLALQIEEKTMDIPLVTSEIVMWDGGDGQYPHLHFICPRCKDEQNVDLYDSDENPRFACCDYCGLNAPVWIQWNERKSDRATER